MSSSHHLLSACLHIAKTAGVMGAKPQLAPDKKTFRGTATSQVKAQNPKLLLTIQQNLAQEDQEDGVV